MSPLLRHDRRLSLAAVAILLAAVRCDCGASVVGRDRGTLVMLDTGMQILDATADASGARDAGVLDRASLDGAMPVDVAQPVDAAPGDTRDAQPVDTAAGTDLGAGDGSTGDGAASVDSGAVDGGGWDGTSVVEAGPDAAGACAASCVPVDGGCHACVEIFIDNFCNTSVVPAELTVPADTTLTLTFYNRSVDYAADIWSSRNYGVIELPTGATWEDPIWHCSGPNPYTEYFDISIYGGSSSACPGQRFNMHCQ